MQHTALKGCAAPQRPLARPTAAAVVLVLAGILSGCAVLTDPAATAPPPAAPAPIAEAFALPRPEPDPARQLSLRERQRADAIARLELVIDEDDAIRGSDQGLPGRRFDNIWDRIRAGFAMPPLDTPLVERMERFYLSKPDYLQRMFARGGRYLFHIVEEIEKRGMPAELALLPFVESAMNPTALSTAQASGLWQFIPSTGRAYNLQQDWWVDNRRDVVKSTQAALEYLQKIYEMQGNDWFLALASYNWGEGAVARAIKLNKSRNRPADYLSLNMPNETRHYVPKLIALKNILLRADELGLAMPALANRPYFVTIEKTRPIDLKLAAEFAGMTVEEFLELNPAHNRPVIAASRNSEIKLPADRLDPFLEAIERHIAAGRPFVTWQPYTMKQGETLEAVAGRAGMTVAELRRANGVRPAARPIAGTRLLIPGQAVDDDRKIEDFEGPRIVEAAEQRPLHHAVARGDTLASIATRHRTTVAQLRKLNPDLQGEPAPGARLLVRAGSNQPVVTAENGRQIATAAPSPAATPVAASTAPAAASGAPTQPARPAATAAATAAAPAASAATATAPAKAAAAATATAPAQPKPQATTAPAKPQATAPAPAPAQASGSAAAPAAKSASTSSTAAAAPATAQAQPAPAKPTAAPAPAKDQAGQVAKPAAAAPAATKPTSPPAAAQKPSPQAVSPDSAEPRRASTNTPPSDSPSGAARPVDRSI